MKENYVIAIGTLKERFGNQLEVIDLHYKKMINLTSAKNRTSSLQSLLDSIGKHLCSLQVMKRNVDQDFFVSMICAKLPGKALLQLKIIHGTNTKWTVNALQKSLNDYITAREHADKKDTQVESTVTQHNNSWLYDVRPKSVLSMNKGNRSYQQKKGGIPFSDSKASGYPIPFLAASMEASVANTKRSSENRFYDQCRYCNRRHWSDECLKYSTTEEQKTAKRQLI